MLGLVRDVFTCARATSPSVLFLDEIDALVGKRSSTRSNGDVVQERILSTLLNEMDGIESMKDVLVMVICLVYRVVCIALCMVCG